MLELYEKEARVEFVNAKREIECEALKAPTNEETLFPRMFLGQTNVRETIFLAR